MVTMNKLSFVGFERDLKLRMLKEYGLSIEGTVRTEQKVWESSEAVKTSHV